MRDKAAAERGVEPAKGVTKKLDCLVIGSVGSEFWRRYSLAPRS